MGRLLVILQIAGIGMTGVAATLGGPHRPPFVVLSLLGALLGLVTLYYNRVGNFSIWPKPLEKASLITNGPYRFIRHPMYLSVMLFLLGVAMYTQHVMGYVGFGLATTAMVGKTYLEERWLLARFPSYAAYQERTKRIIPFLF